MNLIYQVYLGEEKKLYNHCTKSVKEYAKKIGAHYEILTAPKLKITPNVFRTCLLYTSPSPRDPE